MEQDITGENNLLEDVFDKYLSIDVHKENLMLM